jgi:hypothetical protein
LGNRRFGLDLVRSGSRFRARSRQAVALLLIILPIYLVLAAQRDWLENDKLRIILMGLCRCRCFSVKVGGVVRPPTAVAALGAFRRGGRRVTVGGAVGFGAG